MRLTNEELHLISQLLASERVSDPSGTHAWVRPLELPYATVLLAKIAAEQRLRREEIPQNWRDQADEFIARKGAYQCPPAQAGGTFVKQKLHAGQIVHQVESADSLLALLDLGEFTEEES